MLKTLLDSPAVNVFLGTLPLLGAIVWGLLQNDRRLQGLDKRLDGIDTRFDRVDKRFDHVEARLDGIDGKLATVSERLVKVETKIEGGHVVLTR
jgi:tetrahydromethanopterin S-methyltransferase subunit G